MSDEISQSVDQGNNNGGTVAGSFTLSAQMPNGKSLTFSGYVLQGEGIAAVNEKLDLASAVVERQRLAAELPVLEKELEAKRRTRLQFEEQLAGVAAKDRHSTIEKQKIDQIKVNIKYIDDDIKRGELAIAEARRVSAPANGHAAL